MKKRNLSMVKGDTFSFKVNVYGSTSTNFTNILFSCSQNYAGDYIFQKEILPSEDAASEKATYIITVSPEDTKSVIPGDYYYDLQINVNTDVFTLLYGKISILPEVTLQNS